MDKKERKIDEWLLNDSLKFAPLKFLAAALLLKYAGSFVSFDSVPKFLDLIIGFIVNYSMLSLAFYFIRLTRNLLVGIIVFIVFFVVLNSLNLPTIAVNILSFVLAVGGFALDSYRISKLIKIWIADSNEKE